MVNFSVNNIRSQLTKGGYRPTLFRVFCTNPIDGKGDEKFSFLAKGTQVPASTLGVIEVPYLGRKIKVDGDRTYAELTITVMADEDFLVKDSMESWSNAINNHAGNTRSLGATPDVNSYVTDVRLNLLSKDGSIIRTYVLRNCWPSEVAQMDVNWETNDTIAEYDITFQYDFFEVEAGPTGNMGGGTID